LLDPVAALLERVLQVVVVGVVVPPISRFLHALLFVLGLIQALLEVLDLFVLASIQFLLAALFDDAIVEVDARDEGAGNRRYESCEDKPLLGRRISTSLSLSRLMGPLPRHTLSFLSSIISAVSMFVVANKGVQDCRMGSRKWGI